MTRNACKIICGVSGIVASPVNSRIRAPLIAATGGSICRSTTPKNCPNAAKRIVPADASSVWPHPSLSPRGLAEGRNHRFDGEKQGPAVFRIFDELGALHIEALRGLVLGVDQHRSDADALRGDCNAAQRIRENVCAQAFARMVAADGQSSDHRDWDRVRRIAPYL